MSSMAADRHRWWIWLAVAFALACSGEGELQRIPGTTARIGEPTPKKYEVIMKIFTTMAQCGNVVGIIKDTDPSLERARNATLPSCSRFCAGLLV